ncbi:uncharacterized protein [Triticum aestivum]|uniref:uncharacterized protein n=1 Tax=Triticum aestivum TaxID=4565 RepID=UPI001D001EC6|nr:uncharacterized protein LOC123124557 [Triticum aestivum]XP_044401081.1 uncharacterized protein LOC123124557 [Triticum aestivum]XP_044401082.1 uncharacterized protein LOC123124557 [Triticum aestivum]
MPWPRPGWILAWAPLPLVVFALLSMSHRFTASSPSSWSHFPLHHPLRQLSSPRAHGRTVADRALMAPWPLLLCALGPSFPIHLCSSSALPLVVFPRPPVIAGRRQNVGRIPAATPEPRPRVCSLPSSPRLYIGLPRAIQPHQPPHRSPLRRPDHQTELEELPFHSSVRHCRHRASLKFELGRAPPLLFSTLELLLHSRKTTLALGSSPERPSGRARRQPETTSTPSSTVALQSLLGVPSWSMWVRRLALVPPLPSPWPELAGAARPAPAPLPLFCARVGGKKRRSGRRELTEPVDPAAPPVSDPGG